MLQPRHRTEQPAYLAVVHLTLKEECLNTTFSKCLCGASTRRTATDDGNTQLAVKLLPVTDAGVRLHGSTTHGSSRSLWSPNMSTERLAACHASTANAGSRSATGNSARRVDIHGCASHCF